MNQLPSRLVAHTPPRDKPGDWHYLDDHSRTVAERAAGFAAPFGGHEIAWWLGLLHDAGKAHPDFQHYLAQCALHPDRRFDTVDHKTTGAAALSSSPDLPQILLGHHGGLADLGAATSAIRDFVRNQRSRFEVAWPQFQSLGVLPDGAPPPTPSWATATPLAHEFYLRMLFSCLVDADALDTEAHWTPEASAIRAEQSPTIAELWEHFEASQSALLARVSASPHANSAINRVRADVYTACLARASLPPGFFRLTVPTGGGKTRSATAFALQHALTHGLSRVIFAMPFLTITEQTTDILRKALGGQQAVLEHHSGIMPIAESETGEETPEERWRQLASENWDAPVVVTTSVQLFESLLARGTRQCRKLHNIARSVIILDEFQTIPAHLRAPIFDVLRELVTNYGTSVVLCTATQPVLDTIEEDLALADISVTELAPDPAEAFRVLERVRYEWPAQSEKWNWERVATEVQTANQSLTIVNTVRQAAELYRALDDPNALHLSTKMCGAHRRSVLNEIRIRLQSGQPCRVVSTQLVEAGVDLDFPLVLRAAGPLDRIVQAAGRCNREGRLPNPGRVVVFAPMDDSMPTGAYRQGADVLTVLLNEGAINLTDPTIIERYFRILYADVAADAMEIQRYRAERYYEEVAHRFRMIDDDTFPMLVPYNNAALVAKNRLLDSAHSSGRTLKYAFREIQPYIVTARTGMRDSLEAAGAIIELRPGLWSWEGDYDPRLGIILPDGKGPSAARLDVENLFI